LTAGRPRSFLSFGLLPFVAAVCAVVALVLVVEASTSSGDRALLWVAAIALGLAAVAMVVTSVADNRRRATEASTSAEHDASVATALMHARTVAEVGQIAVDQARHGYGASFARLAVRGERDLFTYVADSLPADVHDEHAFVSLHGEDPAAVALRARAGMYWSRFTDFAKRHRRAADVFAPLTPASLAFLPLTGEREPIGVWVLGFGEERAFSRAERRRIEHAAVEISVALERSLLFEFERSVATELQSSLLGPPVLIERAGHCARYIPAVSALSVGGDWYDTMPLADGRIGVAVGDAVGRGLGAATVMGQLRSALGACSLRSADAADAIDCLDEFTLNLSAASGTTVAYAVVDLHTHVVEYCCAGHPPPVCVTRDGDASLLEGALTWPLGLGVARPRPMATHEFPEGALLILYSDGLVERRHQSLDVGLERLLTEAAGRARLPIERLADELLDVMLADSDGSDDVVLLLLRSPVRTPELFLRKVRAAPGELRRVRAEVSEWLRSTGVDEQRSTDLLIAIGEACMNVVQHAYSDELHQLVRIEGAVIDGELVLTVTDTGTWKEHSSRSVGGRGMRLMRRLVPTVEYTRRTGGTSVTFRCPIGQEHDGPVVHA
jgi:serine phosphatase RsbU (regulator of sigma subunit)/anti-sigma regulatory factor (Ser/Thr protein kinase)